MMEGNMASKDQDHAAVSRKAATAKPTNVGGGDVGRTLMNPQWNFHEPKPTTLQIYTAAGGRWAKAKWSEWAGGPGDEPGDVTHTRAKRWGIAGGGGGGGVWQGPQRRRRHHHHFALCGSGRVP